MFGLVLSWMSFDEVAHVSIVAFLVKRRRLAERYNVVACYRVPFHPVSVPLWKVATRREVLRSSLVTRLVQSPCQ